MRKRIPLRGAGAANHFIATHVGTALRLGAHRVTLREKGISPEQLAEEARTKGLLVVVEGLTVSMAKPREVVAPKPQGEAPKAIPSPNMATRQPPVYRPGRFRV